MKFLARLIGLERASCARVTPGNLALALLGATLVAACNDAHRAERVGAGDWREALPEGAGAAVPSGGGSAVGQARTPQAVGEPSADSTADAMPVEAVGADAAEGTAASEPAATEAMRLLSPGAAPRTALRLLPVVGSKANVLITNVPSVKVTVDGKLAPQQVAPGSEIQMAFAVAEVNPEQSIRYTYEIISSGVAGTGLSPQLSAAANKSYSLLKGLTGWAQLSSRGQQQDGGVRLPEGIPEAARAGLAMMEQGSRPMVPPLPEPEVGVGAKWQHTQTIQQGPMQMQQVSEYLLKSNTDGLLVLEMKIEQSASAQDLPGPNGQSVKMGAMSGSGTGLVQMSLDSIVPRSARLQITTVGEMTSQGQTAKIESTQTMTMKPVPAAKASKTTVVNAPGVAPAQ